MPIDDPASARTRLLSGDYVTINSTPTFKLVPGQRIYTIGSCFARNVEQALLQRGFELPTMGYAAPPELYVAKPRYANTVLNKYTPHSIAEEIMRALDRIVYPDLGLIELPDGRWYDPQTSHMLPMTGSQALEVRFALDDLAQNLLTADVLLVTLGFTETWAYRPTGAILNQFAAHIAPWIQDHVDFFNPSFTEVHQVLAEAFHELKNVNPALRIVVTVSPVPLQATFTVDDIVAANTRSKSVLRGVADELSRIQGVDYFPSYEMVVNSPREITWANDQVHVKDEMVTHVIGEFVRRYT